MDPRMREDDGVAPFLPPTIIPAKPALDLIGGQESIPLGLARTQVLDFALQVDSPGAAVPALGQ